MADAELFPYRFTRDDLIKEIDRELVQRGIVYPRLIANKKLSSATMHRRIAMMKRIREIIAGSDPAPIAEAAALKTAAG